MYKFTQTGAEIQRILNSVQTFDSTPTEGSTNPVTSEGIKAAIDNIPEIEVDTALSETSENPVQNKVITEALSGMVYIGLDGLCYMND